ncbi:MAG: prepilin-type N-terminal cleavage/methylation domain-containing protein [Geminicoccaceae bacterium]
MNAQRGLTVVEVLISLALLGVVVALVGSSSRLFARAGDTVGRHAETVFEETLARSLVTDRIEGALYLNIGDAGDYEVAFEGDATSLRFLALRPRYEKGTALVLTEFALLESGSKLVVRIAGARPDEIALEPLGDVTERVLFDNLDGAAFAYLRPGETANDPGRWEDRWTGEPRLPMAVRILFDDPRRPPVIARLKLTSPPECASQRTEALREGCDLL